MKKKLQSLLKKATARLNEKEKAYKEKGFTLEQSEEISFLAQMAAGLEAALKLMEETK